MLLLGNLDLDEIAEALSDQTDYEHRWLIDPRTGEIAFWTSDTGIDGETPVDLDDLDLIPIDPLPSYIWYQDMADFADGVSDQAAAGRLARAIDGRGAFHRFKRELCEECDVSGHPGHPNLRKVTVPDLSTRSWRIRSWLSASRLVPGSALGRVS